MKNLIDKFSWQAIEHDEDGATAEYYKRLREEKKFYTTKCSSCGHVAYPPRPFCPKCFGEEVAWEDVGAKGGTLYAFTTQAMAMRFMAPDVIGIVEIPGVARILSKINGKLADMKIGMKLKFEPFQVSDKITVHTYTPVEP